MLFNFTSIIDWCVVTNRKQGQVDIDNVWKHVRRVRHDQATGNLVYVENTVIYLKLYYKKQGPYIINEVYTNGTVWVQRGIIKKRINIRWLVTHFEIVELVPWRAWITHIWGVNYVIYTTPLQASVVVDTVHQSVRFVRMMRSWGSNLGIWPLWTYDPLFIVMYTN